MRRFASALFGLILVLMVACQPAQKDTHTLSKNELQDKIKGAWAAQTIGVTFGRPVEFKYNSTIIPDYVILDWNDSLLAWTYENIPGAYDDIYMDLTFVDVFEKEGLDAPVESFANAFATAEYPLWFANQTARHNILNGMNPPESGHWLNNPCANDIDFQIEADFAGIMAPGMVNTASEICDKIGHIMNYGDGYYGGVYVAAMYALAFVSDDIDYVVEEALKSIPTESEFSKVMQDVIRWHKQYPEDWKQTWFEVHRKWSSEVGGAVGVYDAFNIEAKINAAWVIMGLLYGEGDFTRTFEISTRCGDDADCNPATAGGILGAIKGYDAIPEFWTQGLSQVESQNFKYTDISLNKVYQLSYEHALEVIQRNGGTIDDNLISIKTQEIIPVPLEIAFEGHYPTAKPKLNHRLSDSFNYTFTGKGFVMRGKASKTQDEDYIFRVEMFLDDELVEVRSLSTDFITRSFYLFWTYDLEDSQHEIRLNILNPSDKAEIYLDEILIYGSEPRIATY